ncbi:MAG: hypothetical protein N2045_03075 [Fimbriimonadales bacterium]|nr:hypothetical protein [Fimbriimonadales bacterium]
MKRYTVGWIGVLLLAALLSGCGGGGGGAVSGTLLGGTVLVPEGTPRSRGLGGYALADATVRAYLTSQPDIPIAQATTDENGRFTLQLPASAALKSVLLVAEKGSAPNKVRVMTLVPSVDPAGQTGIALDAATTLATEEVVRYAREQNLSALSPNGFAQVVHEVRQRLESLTSLDLRVGITLPEEIGKGIRNESLANTIREVVNTYKNSLQPAQGDVATAKRMMQMLRDMAIGVSGTGTDESLELDLALSQQEQLIENEIFTPLDRFKRSLDFMIEVMGLAEVNREDYRMLNTLVGQAPGVYEEIADSPYAHHLVRRDNTTGNTWQVFSDIREQNRRLVLTVQTQNALSAFDWTPDAGRITIQVRRQGDTAFQQDIVLAVTQRDSQNRPTQLEASITIRDPQLREPIQFTGVITGTPRNGDEQLSFSSLGFNGNLTSQYATLSISNLGLTLNTYGDITRATAGTVQVQLRTSKPVSLAIQSLDVQWLSGTDLPSLVKFSSLTMTGMNRTLSLSNAEVEFFYSEAEDQSVPRKMTATVSYTSPVMKLNGRVEGTWQNPELPFPLDELFLIPVNRFPRGSLTFNGSMEPAVGRPASVEFTLNLTPTANPPTATLNLELGYGSESLSGTMRGTFKVQSGAIRRGDWFSAAEATFTHSPSNFVLTLSQTSEGVSGTIRKSDNTTVAQIGEARDLGLPDLGDTLIIKYSDNTFETLASLTP